MKQAPIFPCRKEPGLMSIDQVDSHSIELFFRLVAALPVLLLAR